MSTYRFTQEEINKLRENPYVLKCSKKSITYTYGFKVRAVEQYFQGVSPKEIWRSAGLDIQKYDYQRKCLLRWRKIVERKGRGGLVESRGRPNERTTTNELTDQARIKRFELQVAYLKAENDFLAKLRAKKSE